MKPTRLFCLSIVFIVLANGCNRQSAKLTTLKVDEIKSVRNNKLAEAV